MALKLFLVDIYVLLWHFSTIMDQNFCQLLFNYINILILNGIQVCTDGKPFPSLNIHKLYVINGTVFTPNDPPADWLMAKILVSQADFGYFQVTSHWSRAHMYTEPVSFFN